MWTSKRSKNLQSSRPRLAIDSPRELAKRKGAPPGADRSPAAMGELESSLRVTCGTQHVINQDGPEHPSSLIPPFIQHITVSVQLSQSPSVNTNSSIGNEIRSISFFFDSDWNCWNRVYSLALWTTAEMNKNSNSRVIMKRPRTTSGVDDDQNFLAEQKNWWKSLQIPFKTWEIEKNELVKQRNVDLSSDRHEFFDRNTT